MAPAQIIGATIALILGVSISATLVLWVCVMVHGLVRRGGGKPGAEACWSGFEIDGELIHRPETPSPGPKAGEG